MLEWLESTTSSIYSAWVSQSPETMALTAVSFAVAVGIAWGLRELLHAKDQQYVRQYVPRLREKALRRERIKYVAALSADRYLHGMEQLVWSGEITRFEAGLEYRKIAKLLRNKNIIPPPLSLKAKLKALADKKKLHPATTPPIQNKAGSVVRVAFGDKSIRRQKRA